MTLQRFCLFWGTFFQLIQILPTNGSPANFGLLIQPKRLERARPPGLAGQSCDLLVLLVLLIKCMFPGAELRLLRVLFAFEQLVLFEHHVSKSSKSSCGEDTCCPLPCGRSGPPNCWTPQKTGACRCRQTGSTMRVNLGPAVERCRVFRF